MELHGTKNQGHSPTADNLVKKRVCDCCKVLQPTIKYDKRTALCLICLSEYAQTREAELQEKLAKVCKNSIQAFSNLGVTADDLSDLDKFFSNKVLMELVEGRTLVEMQDIYGESIRELEQHTSSFSCERCNVRVWVGHHHDHTKLLLVSCGACQHINKPLRNLVLSDLKKDMRKPCPLHRHLNFQDNCPECVKTDTDLTLGEAEVERKSPTCADDCEHWGGVGDYQDGCTKNDSCTGPETKSCTAAKEE